MESIQVGKSKMKLTTEMKLILASTKSLTGILINKSDYVFNLISCGEAGKLQLTRKPVSRGPDCTVFFYPTIPGRRQSALLLATTIRYCNRLLSIPSAEVFLPTKELYIH